MKIIVGEYEFDGPFDTTALMYNEPGLFAVLIKKGGSYMVLDVDETSQMKPHIENHSRHPCWEQYAGVRSVLYALMYTPGIERDQRRKTVDEIRAKLTPPCGEVTSG
ncbi:MAG: hypothetical protein L0154_16610 [Chloroflexi bacterium]|nr:hypothetical protein [Chloroflexota bacterium]